MSATGNPHAAIQPHSAAANGFTLMEMLVVVAITALVAGIMFPAIERSLSYWGYRASVISIMSGLQGARARALRSNRQVRFSVSSGGDGFAVTGAPPIALAPPFRVSGFPASVDFYGDGSSNGGRIGVSGDGHRSVIRIAPQTGLASVAG